MANSLADQLLKAGLVDEKKVKQVHKEKKKKQKQQFKNKEAVVDESKIAAQKAMEEKQRKSRELNQQKETEMQSRAIAAQIKQLIKNHAIKREGDVAYNFVDAGKVKKIYVDTKLQGDLENGRLAIVKQGADYEVLPAVIADKIAQRDAACVLLNNKQSQACEEDDPYADYPIPDDLMW